MSIQRADEPARRSRQRHRTAATRPDGSLRSTYEATEPYFFTDASTSSTWPSQSGDAKRSPKGVELRECWEDKERITRDPLALKAAKGCTRRRITTKADCALTRMTTEATLHQLPVLGRQVQRGHFLLELAGGRVMRHAQQRVQQEKHTALPRTWPLHPHPHAPRSRPLRPRLALLSPETSAPRCPLFPSAICKTHALEHYPVWMKPAGGPNPLAQTFAGRVKGLGKGRAAGRGWSTRRNTR